MQLRNFCRIVYPPCWNFFRPNLMLVDPLLAPGTALLLTRGLQSSSIVMKKKNILSDPLPPIRVKDADVKVLLLGVDDSTIGVMKKSDAQARAKKEDLKAVNIKEYPALQAALDRPAIYPVYKLISGDDLHKIQLADRDRRKAEKIVREKILQLTSTATDHDILTKIKQAEEWLTKGDNVRVVILGKPDVKARMGQIYELVLKQLKTLYHPVVADLSKTERNIRCLLKSVAVPEDSKIPTEENQKETKEEVQITG
ncbi:translation initiation factor IF-3-like [Paramacrobiotus metropolitanus]|uniref:translation initiation factor IF-3-like n=1 Tax=Paramacrobiotus metropolitanus TaxID=2943436 RepID=UPI0024464FE3|nr:translation initiation factor IF-3-like [Paramacrobiotus metropolitanus]